MVRRIFARNVSEVTTYVQHTRTVDTPRALPDEPDGERGVGRVVDQHLLPRCDVDVREKAEIFRSRRRRGPHSPRAGAYTDGVTVVEKMMPVIISELKYMRGSKSNC